MAAEEISASTNRVSQWIKPRRKTTNSLKVQIAQCICSSSQWFLLQRFSCTLTERVSILHECFAKTIKLHTSSTGN